LSDQDNIVYLRDHSAALEPPAGLQTGDGQGDGAPRPPRPKLKKLRLLFIFAGLAGLAAVSTVFGMMMAVAADLPDLENRSIYHGAQNSKIYDVNGRQIGLITGSQNQVLVGYNQISPAMRNAMISIEDRRFYDNRGIDVRGIGRALYQDLLNKSAAQGGSTIAQQFVKNALQAQQKRTLFQKLREAALAYHLTKKWSKQKILTEYMNSIYYGNGAYGIESAARTYFGTQAGIDVCGRPGTPGLPVYCAPRLRPAQAALIAGVVASPAGYDPAAHPVAAKSRRDLVLANMLDQGYIDKTIYDQSVQEAIPAKDDIRPPREESQAPYFTTWVKQQVVDRFGAQRAFAGGLKIKTTLDLELQAKAKEAVDQYLTGVGPIAALVAIDNRTGGVAAMVGGLGDNYNEQPFNLATQGSRQPGSAFKPFVLAEALRKGVSPDSTWESKQKIFKVPNSKGDKEFFVVNNYNKQYGGIRTLTDATAQSDNSVFAELGIKMGTRRISRLARRMGIRSPVSDNIAMTLGGLKQGVSPLDMANAYRTLARSGIRSWGTLSTSKKGPTGLLEVRGRDDRVIARNMEKEKRVLPLQVAQQENSMLEGVIRSGTGTDAQIDGFAAGKTGTTENYGDAWFVGFNEYYTVAVWVGYSDRLKPMLTEDGGGPVAGGTIPARIWSTFMSSALDTLDQRNKLSKNPNRILPDGKPANDFESLQAGSADDGSGSVDADGDGIPDDQQTGDTTTTTDGSSDGSGDTTGQGDTGTGDTGTGDTGTGDTGTGDTGTGDTGTGDTGTGDGGTGAEP
jgi:penicillin-binding protein 1A